MGEVVIISSRDHYNFVIEVITSLTSFIIIMSKVNEVITLLMIITSIVTL